MIKYETLFLIKPDLPEDEIQAVMDRLVDRVGRVGGKVAIINHWGNMDMAYPVRYRGERLRRGYYVLLTYLGDGVAVEEIERNIKIMDQTFRYLTVKLEDSADPALVTEIVVTRQAPRTRVRPDYRQPFAEDGDESPRHERGEVPAYAAEGPAAEADEAPASAAPEAETADAEPGADEPDTEKPADDDAGAGEEE
jgi:small subunit ribosomal protein S6